MFRYKFLFFLFVLPFVLVFNGQGREKPAMTPEGGLNFTDSGQNLGNEWSNDVALGDLDGDGDQDAMVINSTPASQVWINQGGEQSGTPGVFLDSGQSLNTIQGQAVSLGDVDGDADLDAFVVLSFFTDSHQVWINQGGAQGGTPGVFQRNSHAFNDPVSTNVVLADVDGDTDLDAYITRLTAADLLFLNDGSGNFTDSGLTLESGNSWGVAVDDVDGDGDLDAFVAVDGPNKLWLNQGGVQGGTEGVFLDSGQMLGSLTSLNVVLSDLDNDADVDAFVANATENIIWVNQGGAQGGTPGVFFDSGQALGFSSSLDVKTADFDNDNDLDAFIAEGAGNTVWVNQGGVQGGTIGVFLDSGLALGSSFSQGVALADVDGDDDIDAFIANVGPAPNKVYLNESGPPPPPVNPEGWQIQLVETRGDTGYSPSIALDSDGRPHIAYVSYIVHPGGNSHRLYHLYWDGVRWHTELIAVADDISGTVSLALDSNDRPHIAYAALDGPDEGLTHAYWDGSQWQSRQIELDNFADNVSLALDSSNNPHVTYGVTEPDRAFKYAVWTGVAWQKHTIETADFSFGSTTSLALDSSNRPHIAYLKESEEALRYAHYNGSSWQINTVDTANQFSIFDPFFSLKLSGNPPSIAYYKNFGATLNYAQWNGSSWQIETLLTLPFPQSLTGSVSLAMDSAGNPAISYAHDNGSALISLRYIRWDGAQWQNEILDNSGSLGESSAITFDGSDILHVAYQDQTFADLRYMTWAANWQIRTVADPGQMAAVDVAAKNTVPYLAYHNMADNLVNLARWDDTWVFNPVDAVNNPVQAVSLGLSENFEHLSYYDADAQALMYGRHNEFGWQVQVVDNQGNVGRYNQLALIGGSDSLIHIAYWDETNRQIKLAVRNADTFELHTNTAAPTLPPGSGPLSAAVLADGNIGIAYYDAANTGLRFALWNAEMESWSDEPVDGNGGDIGRLNSMQADGDCGCPVVAYYDETNDALKYAYRTGAGWQIETVTPSAGGVSSLSLELGLNSLQRPRLAYMTAHESHFAHKDHGSWAFETIAEGLNNPGSAALGLDIRPHIAYPDVLDGLQYIFRTATLDVDTTIPAPPEVTGGEYNPLSPCQILIEFILEEMTSAETSAPIRPILKGSGEEGPLADEGVFKGMSMLFGQTAAGQNYIDLYLDHAPEMAQIGLDDPQLMWDGYGTLQNFMPGLEGLVTGSGDEFIVTQEMVDDALDVWTRIAAVAGPQLANTINTQLAQSNNLQDYVGLSFDEWAVEIGVEPPADGVYLPAVFR
jgi:hypothetical protein